jgi:hypothetical protein
METVNRCVYILTATLLLAACSPEPVLRLQHDSGDDIGVTAYRGMEYLISDKEESSAILAYYRHLGNRVIMDLEVINFSDEMIRFEPADFTYILHGRHFDWDPDIREGEWRDEVLSKGSAIDPESMLLQIDKETSRTVARERTNRVLDGIAVGLDVASEISAAGREPSGDRAYREARRTRDAMIRADRRDNFYRNVANMSDNRVYWESETLRTTDLMPGESIAGEISFPSHKDARTIEIMVRIGEEEHRFLYQQKVFQP